MKSNNIKKLFIENLKKVPIVQVACEKSGVSRATVYRWRDKDKKFRKTLNQALSEGEALVNDMSESQLISLIKEKNFSAIRFWLNHRHEKFKERVEITTKAEDQEKLSPEQQKIVREALKLASLGKKKVTNK
ncbi:MAG: phBC6A51 family helix-turn-helix protein [bacterium]